MIIDAPKPHRLPLLKQLWQEAFGDSDAFTELFFSKGFSCERCLVAEEESVLGALYWFDCAPGLAYIYGVGVFRSSRGKGVGLALMEAAHRRLQSEGYSGCILCPADEALFRYYEKLGYTACAPVAELVCEAGEPLSMEKLSCEAYACRRSALLPANAAQQGREAVRFLGSYAGLYGGSDFLVAAVCDEGTAYGELLGNKAAAPGITAALGCKKGIFRMPDGTKPFAMFLPLKEGAAPPAYLGMDLG